MAQANQHQVDNLSACVSKQLRIYSKYRVGLLKAGGIRGNADIRKDGMLTQQIVRSVQHSILASLPEKRDMTTYENADGGVNITLDKDNDSLTGNNLTHLAKFADDQGWNDALTEVYKQLDKLFQADSEANTNLSEESR